MDELWVSTKCGESDTTSGLASCPTVGNLIDKIDPMGATTCFGETTELTRAEVEQRLAQWGVEVVVANHNSPTQVVAENSG